jgi:hypothetical protein
MCQACSKYLLKVHSNNSVIYDNWQDYMRRINLTPSSRIFNEIVEEKTLHIIK